MNELKEFISTFSLSHITTQNYKEINQYILNLIKNNKIQIKELSNIKNIINNNELLNNIIDFDCIYLSLQKQLNNMIIYLINNNDNNINKNTKKKLSKEIKIELTKIINIELQNITKNIKLQQLKDDIYIIIVKFLYEIINNLKHKNFQEINIYLFNFINQLLKNTIKLFDNNLNLILNDIFNNIINSNNEEIISFSLYFISSYEFKDKFRLEDIIKLKYIHLYINNKYKFRYDIKNDNNINISKYITMKFTHTKTYNDLLKFKNLNYNNFIELYVRHILKKNISEWITLKEYEKLLPKYLNTIKSFKKYF